MKRWQRKALRRLGALMINAAYWLDDRGADLQSLADRQPPRPLAFPSQAMLEIQELLGDSFRSMATHAARQAMKDIAFFGESAAWVGIEHSEDSRATDASGYVKINRIDPRELHGN